MFQHLKLLPHKDLPLTLLSNLGKINVVCGKNSSGKSTLLAAIDNSNTRRIGMELDSIAVDSLITNSMRGTGWSGQPSLYAAYREAVLNTVRSKAVLYNGEEAHFALEVSQSVNTNPMLRPYGFQAAYLSNAYKELLKEDVSTVIVAPKRFIELKSTIRMDAEVLPHGYGMLPHLFYAKNQPVNTQDGKTYAEISKVFTEISSGAKFDIIPAKDSNVSLMFAQGDEYTPAENVGLGLQELLVILFFAIRPDYEVILLEEPESHLHPEWQRKLLSYLRTDTQKQYFITTHSNIFLDAGLVDKVFYTSFNGKIAVDDATNRAAVLSDLGYAVTDNLVSDLVILVEGPGDVQVIKEFLIKMELWEKYNIKLWPLGGDIMAQLDLSVFSERNNILALVDNDKGSNAIRKEFIANCNALNISVTRLGRYAIENYFSLRAIQTVMRQFGQEISTDITALKTKEPVEKQLGFSVKRNNRLIAQEMSLDEIRIADDLFTFLETVRQKCEAKDISSP